MQEFHVDSPEGLAGLCEQLRDSPWLALDTEFMREKTYYAQLCLLQVSNGELAASIDPLKLPDLSPLLDIVYDPGAVKVFHSGRQDLELFHQLWGRLPQPLFDTQPAAELAGFGNQVGYANLVRKMLGHELEKGHTRADWSRRPLRPEQLRYALDDVIYLGRMYLKLRDDLGERLNDAALQRELDRLSDPTTYVTRPEDAWLRLKARKFLKGNQLAVLQALAGWRETEAIRADKPRGWILKNEALFELSRTRPQTPEQLNKVRGLPHGLIKRRGAQLLKLIGQTLELPESEWPREPRKP